MERFRVEMDDDFGTPGALAAIFDATGQAHQALDAGDRDRAASLLAAVLDLTDALGLPLEAGAGADAEIDALVAERDAARARRDFATSDRIRDDLAARGVVLEDTGRGTVWHRR